MVLRAGATLQYDEDGNLTSDGEKAYAWDARNRLVSLSGGGVAASFSYDAFGRRVTKTVNGVQTRYLYDGVDAVQEQSSGGAPSANMLVGGVDEVFTRTDSQGAVSLLHDGLGSALALTDTNGALTGEYSYEPFGNTTQAGASANASQYTGRENDATGLYYYRSRYYSPSLQRFISEDGLDFLAGDTNLYAYVGNDPCNSTDPSGHVVQALVACGGGAIFDAAFYSAMALSGRKTVEVPFNWADFARAAGIGCASGVAGYGIAKAATAIWKGWRIARAARAAQAADRTISSVGGVVRQFEQQGTKIYYRVYSGDATTGAWLTSVPPKSSAWAREALALPPWNKATHIQEVVVPNGTLLERSRAIAVPQWGRFRGGAEQFKLLEAIPDSNFGLGRPLP